MTLYAKKSTATTSYPVDPNFDIPFGPRETMVYPVTSDSYDVVTASYDGVNDHFSFSTSLSAPIVFQQSGIQRIWIKSAEASAAEVQVLAQD